MTKQHNSVKLLVVTLLALSWRCKANEESAKEDDKPVLRVTRLDLQQHSVSVTNFGKSTVYLAEWHVCAATECYRLPNGYLAPGKTSDHSADGIVSSAKEVSLFYNVGEDGHFGTNPFTSPAHFTPYHC